MNIPDCFDLSGKRLFITGGSRGLGREMALAIAQAGADVVLAGRDQASLEESAMDIRRIGRESFPLVADIGNPHDCEAACRQVLTEFGPIDILINNVGGRLINVPITEQSLDDWQKIMDLNVTSTFLCSKLIGGSMIERGLGGRIINIASISGIIANRGIGGRSYETSKAAIIQFTRTAAVDWAPSGVTVNAICPGGFMTAPNRNWARHTPEVIEEFERQIPMGRFGDPKKSGRWRSIWRAMLHAI